MVWATEVVGRELVQDVFKNDHYIGDILGKYKEKRLKSHISTI